MGAMTDPSNEATAALIDRIRARVAVEANVILTKDDPILSVVLIMKEVLQAYGDEITDNLQRNQEVLLAALEAVQASAKETAGKLVTDSATYASKQIAQAGEQLKKDLLHASQEIRAHAAADAARTLKNSENIEQRIKNAHTDVVEAKKGINIAVAVSVVASVVAVIASVVAVLK